ncbi:MAG: hypothetical protein AAB465_00645 [Patescibacteria group bacterium]
MTPALKIFQIQKNFSAEKKIWLISQLYLLGKKLEKLNNRGYDEKNKRIIKPRTFALRHS